MKSPYLSTLTLSNSFMVIKDEGNSFPPQASLPKFTSLIQAREVLLGL